MIKFYCNGCTKDVTSENKVAMHIHEGLVKRQLHFCMKCWTYVKNGIVKGIDECKPKEVEVTEEPIEEHVEVVDTTSRSITLQDKITKKPTSRTDINTLRQVLVRFYKGDTAKTIAAVINKPYASVYQYIVGYACTSVKALWDTRDTEDKSTEEILAFLSGGWNPQAIAEELDISIPDVLDVINKYVGV